MDRACAPGTDQQAAGLPLTEGERLDWLRLLRSRRVGPTTFWRLMEEEGSAAAGLDALPRIAAAAGVRDYAPCTADLARAELDRGARIGARLVGRDEAGYPPGLRELPDAPPLVWLRGPLPVDRPAIGIVGARNASSLGLRMATRLAAQLSAAGWCVVSGLARGIDAAAHEAALSGPGGTLAVMAGGVDIVYPPENADLARRIGAAGLLLSDQPIGTTPQARHFPARNRLISGIARAVVVVEAAARSGSLITARTALDQGREVLAVPGHPFDARAGGANALIRDGAILVRHAEDVIEALGPAPGPAPSSAPRPGTGAVPQPRAVRGPAPVPGPAPGGGPEPAPGRPLREIAQLHRRILDRLGPSPVAEDQLIRDLAAEASAVTPALTDLELEGRIARRPGGLIARAD
ncbi:DNA-processing protein DprA [Wenxinia saemankumensis]|nr:DNA-processing protein DprA [Wenxinia saemankumensis]